MSVLSDRVFDNHILPCKAWGENKSHFAGNIKPMDGQSLPAGNAGGKEKGHVCSKK